MSRHPKTTVGALRVSRWAAAVVAAGSILTVRGAPDPAPIAVGVLTQAVGGVALLPPISIPAGISADGRFILFTSTQDYLVTNDLKGDSDVFVYDRQASRTILVSVNAGGTGSGNGSSLEPAFSSDGRRVVFQSRASDLVAGDTNHTWDVFVRDLETGVTRLLSVNGDGIAAGGPSTGPGLTAGGQFASFESRATDLVTGSAVGTDVYRHEVNTGNVTALGRMLTPAASATDGRMAGDGARVAVRSVIRVTQGTQTRSLPAIYVVEPGGGTALLASPFPTSLLLSLRGYDLGSHGISGDGRWAAFCRLVTVAPALVTNAIVAFDVENRTSMVIDQTTRPFPSRLDYRRVGPVLSEDGRYVAYGLPTTAPGSTNLIVPLYLWDRTTQLAVTITRSTNGTDISNGNATGPVISPDGRFVAFTSDATDLVSGVESAGPRAYWWDRDTGLVALIGAPASADGFGSVRMSANGAWLVAAQSSEAEAPTFVAVSTTDGSSDAVVVAPVATASRTVRGGLRIDPAGVSAEGRYAVVTSLGDDPVGGRPQVLLVDTATGERVHVSTGIDGQPAGAGCAGATISGDGRYVAYLSAATNLVMEDVDGKVDVFVFDRQAGTNRSLTANLSSGVATAYALEPVVLSPDGRFLFFVWRATSTAEPYLAELATGRMVRIALGTFTGFPQWAVDGSRMAGVFGTTATTLVIEPATWFASPPTARVVATFAGKNPFALSPAGNRMAILTPGALGAATLRLFGTLGGAELLSQSTLGSAATTLALDFLGERVVWSARTSAENPDSQIWLASASSPEPAVLSVAEDGTTPGDGTSRYPVFSRDGRFVAFASQAGNLVAMGGSVFKDVFLRDLQTGRTVRLSRGAAGGPGGGWSTAPFFSANGRAVFFQSQAGDLTTDDLNQAADVFKAEVVDAVGSDVLVVLERNLSTGQAQLVWSGVPGKRYRVDFRTDLNEVEWQTLGTTDGTAVSVDLEFAPTGQRFIRVVELP